MNWDPKVTMFSSWGEKIITTTPENAMDTKPAVLRRPWITANAVVFLNHPNITAAAAVLCV